MTARFRNHLALAALGLAAGAAAAQDAPRRDIHLIYMGGDDCPPCVEWRTTQLPVLQDSALFRSIRFTQVNKTVRSAVPPAWLLPEAARPYKEQLDAAGGGNTGSPQTAILVNGKVYDFFRGARMAGDIEGMLAAIRDGTPYPYPRCIKRGPRWACENGG